MQTDQRRYPRVQGPFEGYRIGVIDAQVTIYNLSEGGCFVNCATTAPDTGRHLVLKIEIPDEGWVCLKSQALYAKPGYGFGVSFVELPQDAADRLRRGLRRRQGISPDAEQVKAEPAVQDHESAAAPLSAKRILVADDDDGVRTLVRKALSTYRVQTARSVSEAIALSRDAAADLVITDYLMPDGTGSELISLLRVSQPSLKVLLMTGHVEMLNQEASHWWTTEPHLGKPFTVRDLREAVTGLIGNP